MLKLLANPMTRAWWAKGSGARKTRQLVAIKYMWRKDFLGNNENRTLQNRRVLERRGVGKMEAEEKIKHFFFSSFLILGTSFSVISVFSMGDRNPDLQGKKSGLKWSYSAVGWAIFVEHCNSTSSTLGIFRQWRSCLSLFLCSETQKSLGRLWLGRLAQAEAHTAKYSPGDIPGTASALGPQTRTLFQGVLFIAGKEHNSQGVTTLNFKITLSQLKFSWA